MRTLWNVAAVVALLGTAASVPPASQHRPKETAKAIAAGLASPARADQAGDDARRKAAEVLAFSGVGPGDEVIDLLPGAGYWTRIFAGTVGPSGHVYAVWPAAAAKYATKALPALDALHLGNVTTKISSGIVDAPEPVDIVWTVQNYHDVPNNGGGEVAINTLNASVMKVLKPGGTYIVIDHADVAGSGLANTNTKHRIDPAIVKAEVVKAGFVFVGESDVLKNPADDHMTNVFDPAIKGHTDQFVYRFRKPR